MVYRYLAFKTPWRALGATLLLGGLGCQQVTPPPSSAPEPSAESADLAQVVATNSVLCDLTQQIAQNTVDVLCLLSSGQDPHTYEPTPSDRQAIEDADLILYGGYGLESRVIQLIESSSNPASQVAVYESAAPEPLMGASHEHGGHEGEEHAEGEAHAEGEPVPDPHIWNDAQNGAAIADVVAEQLAQIEPDQAQTYQQAADEIAGQLTEIDAWIQAQVATVPESARKLVTTHEAMAYYADAYGLGLMAALEGLSTEARPSAAEIAELVNAVKSSQVPAVFVESTTNPELIQTVAKNAGVAVSDDPLYVEGPVADSEADTYQKTFIANTCTIVEALGGTCDRASAPL